jgi:tungstate transport system permease protein
MIVEGVTQGFSLLWSFEPGVWHPILLSLTVAGLSILLATLLALPVGMWVGLGTFRGRRVLVSLLNTLMALPTVLVGLIIYGVICRQGPLGTLDLLYTPSAMVIGQVILAFPIVAGLCAASLEKADPRVQRTMLGLGAGRLRAALAVVAESRATLAAAVAAGFGRVFSEVGISMMLGGNVRAYTRNITTGIAFATGKGEFAMGVALGVVLLIVAMVINFSIGYWQYKAGAKK